MSATRVASITDLDDGATMRVEMDGVAVALVRIGDDIYAIGDRCSHADVSLSEGLVDDEECTLECPKHGSAFDLRSGEPESLPALRPVPVWRTRVEGDDILLEKVEADDE